MKKVISILVIALILFACVAESEARWYSPETRRFLTEDPLRFEGGDVNFYAYVRNNPVNYNDPFGLYAPPSPGDYLLAEQMKAKYKETLGGMKNDKEKHCFLACMITKAHGPWTANNVSWAKEFKDAYDGDPKTMCEKEDFEADKDGIKIGVKGGPCIKGCIGKY